MRTQSLKNLFQFTSLYQFHHQLTLLKTQLKALKMHLSLDLLINVQPNPSIKRDALKRAPYVKRYVSIYQGVLS